MSVFRLKQKILIFKAVKRTYNIMLPKISFLIPIYFKRHLSFYQEMLFGFDYLEIAMAITYHLVDDNLDNLIITQVHTLLKNISIYLNLKMNFIIFFWLVFMEWIWTLKSWKPFFIQVKCKCIQFWWKNYDVIRAKLDPKILMFARNYVDCFFE